ncbi:TasA family protein [Metabacillus sp. Hm71]|uniref:TasA family protein n=1 Tax=Metabacillus sp. Hm71 TaxID=3450743 RepID=UPI003F435593
MSVKGKILTSIAMAALGLSLMTEGTVAYFNDKEPVTNTFTTGMLDLEINKETIFQLEDLVPGDTMTGNVELINDGSVDMKEVKLHSSYEVVDNGEPNQGDDLGKHIRVEFVRMVNGKQSVVFQKTLAELKASPQQVLKEFPAGSDAEKCMIRITFLNNGKDQNHFQGDQVKLTWEFEAVQRDGKPIRR